MLEATPAVYSILELIYILIPYYIRNVCVCQIMFPLVLRTMQFTISEVEMLADSEIGGKQCNWHHCVRGKLTEIQKDSKTSTVLQMCRLLSILP